MNVANRGPWEGLAIANGRYSQLATLGAGGMGYVYRALDANLQTHVVIKSPRRELIDNPEQISRFEREIRMIQLSYPHIVPVVDVGRHDNVPFAVLRYMSGGNLEDQVVVQAGRVQPMHPASLPAWLPSIAQALDFVHEQGYLHRDVKPQNILFDSHQHAYLSDFGVIKALGENEDLRSSKLTGQGFVLGTVDYMAPELLTNGHVDGRADQYALAVTIYQVLCGQLPFDGNSAAAVMVQHVNVQPPPLTALAPHLSPELAQAVARGLAKSPAARYSTCAELAQHVLHAAAACRTAPGVVAAERAGGSSPAIPPRRMTAAEPAPAASAGRRATAAEALPPAELLTGSRPQAPAATTGSGHAAQTSRRPAGGTAVVAMLPTPPAAGGKGRSTSQSLLLAGGLLTISALVLGGIGFVVLSPSDAEDTQYEELATGSLPRLISQWQDRANKLEQKLIVDSAPLLAKPEYADSKQFKKLLDAQARKPSDKAQAELESLETDLAAIEKLRVRLAADVSRRVDEHWSSGGKEGSQRNEELQLEQRALQDDESRLATMQHRLEKLRSGADASAGNYDAGALAEIAALDEMHRIADSAKKIELSSSTRKRAGELLDCRYEPLRSLALGVLVDAGDRRATRFALDSVASQPADAQARLCWSLLASGKSESVAAAVRQLEANPEAVARLDRSKLLDLIAENPSAYTAVIGPLAAWCKTSDERLRLARIQISQMNAAWSAELEQACRSGLLRDETAPLVVDIVSHKRQAAYALAAKLVEQHPELKLDALEPDELRRVCDDDPVLGSRLAEQVLVKGTAQQRAAALRFVRSPSAEINVRRLGARFQNEPVRDPTSLLNQLVSADDARSLDIAEALLKHVSGLAAGQIDYAKISSAALEREPIRLALANLALKVPDTGRGWALEQIVGPEFTTQFRQAEATRARQAAALQEIARVLNGKQTAIKAHGSAAVIAGKGLEVSASDLAKLKGDFESSDWAPGGTVETVLAALQSKLSTIEKSAGALYASDLGQMDQYLDHMQQWNRLAFQLAGIYDLAVGQQLAGARREVQKKKHPSWNFRFMQTSIQAYEAARSQYETLEKNLRDERRALPNFLVKQHT